MGTLGNLARACPGYRFEAHISRPVLGSAVFEVRGGGPMVDGRYLSGEDFDDRVVYRREADAASTMPEVRLLYSTLHGDRRFVEGTSESVSRAVAFSDDVLATCPEECRIVFVMNW